MKSEKSRQRQGARPPQQASDWRECLALAIEEALRGHVSEQKRALFAERAARRAHTLHMLVAPLWSGDYEKARDALEQAAKAIARARRLLYGDDKADGEHWNLPAIYVRRSMTNRGVEVIARVGRLGLERITRKELGAQIQASITPSGAAVVAWSWCEILEQLELAIAGARALARGCRRPSPSSEVRRMVQDLAADFETVAGHELTSTPRGLFDLCAQATARAAGLSGVRRPDLLDGIKRFQGPKPV